MLSCMSPTEANVPATACPSILHRNNRSKKKSPTPPCRDDTVDINQHQMKNVSHVERYRALPCLRWPYRITELSPLLHSSSPYSDKITGGWGKHPIHLSRCEGRLFAPRTSKMRKRRQDKKNCYNIRGSIWSRRDLILTQAPLWTCGRRSTWPFMSFHLQTCADNLADERSLLL